MENATKALLIAGSVLIAIVLIAVGIKILGSTSGVTEQVGQVSNSLETSIFNSQYTQYQGTQKGTAVKELINKIKTYNATKTEAKEKIKITTKKDVAKGLNTHGNAYSVDTVNKILNEINISYTYNVIVNIDETTGLVKSITIE